MAVEVAEVVTWMAHRGWFAVVAIEAAVGALALMMRMSYLAVDSVEMDCNQSVAERMPVADTAELAGIHLQMAEGGHLAVPWAADFVQWNRKSQSNLEQVLLLL